MELSIPVVVGSTIAFFLFAYLWIYELTIECYVGRVNDTIMKLFSVAGTVLSVFLIITSCYDRQLTLGRGLIGCVVLFIFSGIIFANLLGAYLAMGCICVCDPRSENAFTAATRSDLMIFFLELLGSVVLFAVLFVSINK